MEIQISWIAKKRINIQIPFTCPTTLDIGIGYYRLCTAACVNLGALACGIIPQNHIRQNRKAVGKKYHSASPLGG
jgi:hypothetical protein